jgi:hypothetical protein
MEQLECTSSDNDDDAKSDEGDFSDDDIDNEAKRRKLDSRAESHGAADQARRLR